MKLRSKRLSIGFTLIELLVVISIISILISILLPALGKARKTTITLQCANNQRGVGQAFYQYSGDFEGYFPLLGDSGNSNAAGTSGIWASWVGRLYWGDYLTKSGITKLPYDPPTSNGRIFMGTLGCPTMTVASGYGYVGSVTENRVSWENIGTNYGLNWPLWRNAYPNEVLGRSSSHYIPLNPDEVPKPSSVMMIGDIAFKNVGGIVRLYRASPKVTNAAPVNWWENADFRHGFNQRLGTSSGSSQVVNYDGVMNSAFLDGHVEGLREEQVPISTSNKDIWEGGL